MVASVLPSTPGRDRLLSYVRANPGLALDDLSRDLDMPKSTVSRYLRGAPEQRLVVTRKDSDYTTYSDAVKVEAMLEAWAMLDSAHQAKGMSRKRYDELLGHRADRPSSVTFIRRFGSWSEACRAAGVAASERRRERNDRLFSDDGIVRFTEETGATTFARYCAWAQGNGSASGPLVIIRLGSWSGARRLAVAKGAERAVTHATTEAPAAKEPRPRRVRHLTVMRDAGESIDEYTKRLAELVARHFGDGPSEHRTAV